MTERLKIIVFNRTFLPGFKEGGPIRSISNLISRLGSEFDFSVVTRDRDIGDTTPYKGIMRNKWNTMKGCKVFYWTEDGISIAKIRRLIEDERADVIHLNSFFDAIFTQRVVWAKRLGWIKSAKICVAPKGEFSKGAIAQKRLKKKLFTTLAGLIGLYKGVHWHASSELEAADIQRELLWVKRKDISIALDLAPIPDIYHTLATRRAPANDELVLAFLSRIVPKKNLSFALKVLAEMSIPVKFLVYGTREDDAYWDECETLIRALPPRVRVEYQGFVLPDEVPASLAKADMFLFPTLGENYGHVIHEALCAGLPVLLSDQTPWDKVVEKNVGWVFPLGDVKPYVRAIESYWALSVEERSAMADRAIAYGNEVARNDTAVQDHIRMFHKLLPGREHAESVNG